MQKIKAVIYYQLGSDEEIQSAINFIHSQIEKIEHEVVGVFVELFNKNEELMNLTHHDWSIVSCLYVNKLPEDEFSRLLLREISRQEDFTVRYLDNPS